MIKTDVAFRFNTDQLSKEFILLNRYSFVSIKKIILSPKFEWKKPDDWSRVLLQQNLVLKITCFNSKGTIRSQPYVIDAFNTPYHYEPVFSLNNPIHIPLSLWEKEPFDNEFPIKITVELSTRESDLKFDIMIVYDAALE